MVRRVYNDNNNEDYQEGASNNSQADKISIKNQKIE